MSKEINFKVKHYSLSVAKELSVPYNIDIDNKIKSHKNITDLVRKIFKEIAPDYNVRETFLCFCLDKQNRITSVTTIGIGGTSAVYVDLKLIGFHAVNSLANSVIIAHNHPSGSIEPSFEDIKLTRKIKEGLKFLDIELIDHIIITDKLSYSFANEYKL